LTAAVGLGELEINIAKWLTNHGTRRVRKDSETACVQNSFDLLNLHIPANVKIQNGTAYDPAKLKPILNTWNSKLVEMLLEAGADPNFGDHNGNTALHIAAFEGSILSLKLLMAYGADVNKKQNSGLLAADIAAAAGHTKATEQLQGPALTSGERRQPPGWHSGHPMCKPHSCPILTPHRVASSPVVSHNNGGWGTLRPVESIDLDRCDFDVRSDLSEKEFFSHYWALQQPVLVRSAINDTHQWSKQNFERLFGKKSFQVVKQIAGGMTHSTTMKLSQYVALLNELENDHYETAKYNMTIVMETRSNKMKKLDALVTQLYQDNDALQLISKSFEKEKSQYLMTNYQLNIGHPYSGASVHFHQMAVTALLHGLKHWFMFPPADAFYSTAPVYHWYSRLLLPEIRTRALECVQYPGDVLFIPNTWGHAALYLRESVSVSYFYRFTE